MDESVLDKKHIKIIVSGRVQGVFFRGATKSIARQLGLKGFVKNNDDGTVSIEAEGTKEQLTKLVIWCKHGPPHATVNDLHVEEGEVKGYKFFEIKH